MDELAIRVEDVSKVYRLYNRPSERLFDALGLAGKGRFKEHRALDHVTFDVKKGETVWNHRNERLRQIYHLKNYHRCALTHKR